jgi:hypothetical protein
VKTIPQEIMTEKDIHLPRINRLILGNLTYYKGYYVYADYKGIAAERNMIVKGNIITNRFYTLEIS